MDRGRLVPSLKVRETNNVLVPPNFLAVVFKKQEISQQVVIGMQYLASEFSKNFPGVILPETHSGRGDPFRTQHPALPMVLGPKL